MTHPSDEPRRDDDTPPPPRRGDQVERAVDEAVEESFPASDPPSWEPLHPGTPDQSPAPVSPTTPEH